MITRVTYCQIEGCEAEHERGFGITEVFITRIEHCHHGNLWDDCYMCGIWDPGMEDVDQFVYLVKHDLS